MTFMARDRRNWPRYLLWHGWLPGLRVAGERDPLGAQTAEDSGLWSGTILVFGLVGKEGCPTEGFEVAGTGVYLPPKWRVRVPVVVSGDTNFGQTKFGRHQVWPDFVFKVVVVVVGGGVF